MLGIYFYFKGYDNIVFLSLAPSAPPENVTLIATSPTSIEVAWNPPEVDYHNGIITLYEITLLELDTETQQNYSSYSTSLVIQSLHPYYAYQIQVSAITVDAGPYSIVQVLQMPEDGNNRYE